MFLIFWFHLETVNHEGKSKEFWSFFLRFLALKTDRVIFDCDDFVWSLLITDLFDNLELEKEIIDLEKKSGKNLEYVIWHMHKALTVVEKRISSGLLEAKQECWNKPKRIVTRPVLIGS